MIVKLTFWRGNEPTFNDAFIVAERVWVVDPPVPNGVGNLHMEVANPIWTGACHLWVVSGRCFVPIGSIDSVHTRSNDNESDEPWVELFHRNKSKPSTYEGEAQLIEILRGLQLG